MASVNSSHDDDDDGAVDSINITPLVDVLMVVLVMFILTATAQVAGIQINLPKASATVALSQPKTKAISVNDAGQVFLDAYPVTLPELEDRLRTEKALNPDFGSGPRRRHGAVPEGHRGPRPAAPPGAVPGRPGHRQTDLRPGMNMSADPKHTPSRKMPRHCPSTAARRTRPCATSSGASARCCSPASPGWSGSGPTT